MEHGICVEASPKGTGIREVYLTRFINEEDEKAHNKLSMSEQNAFFEKCLNEGKIEFIPVDMSKPDVPPDSFPTFVTKKP